ncbi:winged helix DNA-binding domain-containing protein [Aldersonia sp. NBC_00410]|uniref:DNA glycosylase AlkZ-like family protein n=1 Tax=Aldersonia sp. NBC_00410 TaxID=2975954 RepID=UPI0022505B81|nr:crosslink repair DNA glycosylase YcaQ family protein [Aldersonia sp. NBC_00410]MCX5042874.1 winged helix DNA-binding domain-containing protein [Aldersonia sp. NBC_00410]
MTGTRTLSRAEVLGFRWRAHGLDTDPGRATIESIDILDLGIQDTGEGARWALHNRGLAEAEPAESFHAELFYAWTLRGAPHAYRRADAAAIAVATAPLDDRDAGKRIFDAAKPLRDKGIPFLEALTRVAKTERDIVTAPTVKGAMSSALTARLPAEQLRFCRPCNTTHSYEQPFRIAALQAGLELEPATSPPVLRRIPRLRAPMFGKPGTAAAPRFDVVRGYLRFFGPARPKDVAAYLDAPPASVAAHWPADTVAVRIDGAAGGKAGEAQLLAEDADAAAAGPADSGRVRLLGAFDPWLQLRDRELLVSDPARAKDLWRTLGRPGPVVRDGEVIGTWRPRSAGGTLNLLVAPWSTWPRKVTDAVHEQAEALAACRGSTMGKITVEN